MTWTVTPFVGVWIETLDATNAQLQNQVTPFVGVWIETHKLWHTPKVAQVTPFVGVWIETTFDGYSNTVAMCHTLRGCVD